MKKFVFGFLLGAVIFGGIGAFAVAYVANPVSFKILVDGQEFHSDPPALEVEGRTYLPLRAIGDALGIPVTWNEELNQAEVGYAASPEDVSEQGDGSVLDGISDKEGYYESNNNIPDFGVLQEHSLSELNTSQDSVTAFYNFENKSEQALDESIQKYKDILEQNGFSLDSTEANGTMIYKNADLDETVKIFKTTLATDLKMGVYIIFKPSV